MKIVAFFIVLKLRKGDQKYLKSFETCCWMEFTWIDRVGNEEVLY
jgi:hypothetical protein